LRVPHLVGAAIATCAVLAADAAPALAGGTGGVSAVETKNAATAPVAAKPKAKVHTAPVTSRSSNLAYTGPVFQKTPTGEVVPYQSAATTAQVGPLTGGAGVGAAGAPAGGAPVSPAPVKPQLLVPGSTARYVAGLAAAPMAAPPAVQQIIWSANQIIGLPYIYGGGHSSFVSPGYDCSGTVSYALHGGNLLATPEDSSEFEAFGSSGVGRWVSVFANPGHAYMTVAGLRLDTSAADDPSNQQGPRWRPLRSSNGGYTVRHPRGV
jgi:cell wall-associated NlpC family hydrolase